MRLFRDLPIAHKLLGLCLLSSAFAILPLGISLVVHDTLTFEKSMVRRLEAQAHMAGHNSVSALMFHDNDAASQTLEALRSEPSVLGAAIYTPDGELFAAYAPNAADGPPARADEIEANPLRDRVSVFRPIFFEGHEVGGILIVSSLEELSERLWDYGAIVAVVSFLSVVFAAVLTRHFQRLVTGPIVAMADAAKRISEHGDFRARASVPAAGDELGTLVDSFNGMVQKIQLQTEALGASEQRFELAVRGTSDGLWDWDIPSGNVWFAPRFRELLGCSDQELPNRYESWKSRLHPDDDEAVTLAERTHLQRGATYDVNCRLRHADASYRWFRVRGAAVRDVQGEPVRMAGSIQDVTELKRLENVQRQTLEELTAANESLVQSNIELEQFAYIASHDLQAPLRGIAGFAQFLKKDFYGKLGEQADDYLSRIVENAERMRALIEALLVYSRVDTRSRPFEHVSLNEAFHDAVTLLSASIEDAGGTVRRDELPTVIGDRAHLSQLLQNLIGNAIKYHKDAAPKVHLSAKKNCREWTISVRDNGIGIDSKHRERVFEIFRRLHTEKDYPGTGIGLAVCRRIVARHGGRIWVESEVGAGSTFCFTIPEKKGEQT